MANEAEVRMRTMPSFWPLTSCAQLVKAAVNESMRADEEARLLAAALAESARDTDAQALERQLLEAALVQSAVESFAKGWRK